MVITNFTPVEGYAKDGGPEEVRRSCSFHQDPLRRQVFPVMACTETSNVRLTTYHSHSFITWI